MRKIIRGIKRPFLLTLSLLLICGLAYPLLLTGISQVIFSKQSNGSLIMVDDIAVGSELVGQDFTDPRFMKCRPSAVNYNTYTQKEKENGSYKGVSSGSKNYSTTNPDLDKRVKKDIERFLGDNPSIKKEDIPTDLLTASGSGLDPHISPESAKVQIPSLSKATGLSEDTLNEIVKNNTEDRLLGILGEKTVNVLKVNLQIVKELKLIKNITS